MKKLLVFLFVLCLSFFCFASSDYVSFAGKDCVNIPVSDEVFKVDGESVSIVILETTDMHARAYDWNSYLNSPLENNYLQAYEIIFNQRSQYNDSIVLDNGDVLQGSALSTYNINKENGINSPVGTALRVIGYDAFGPGNHEFNYEIPIQWNFYNYLLNPEISLPGKPVSVLSANILETESQNNVFPPYKLFDYEFEDGSKFTLGVIAFENMNIPNWEKSCHYEGLSFAHKDNEKLSCAYEYEKYWQSELESKADFIVAMLHTSNGYANSFSVPEQGLWFATHTRGIDLVFTGHSHIPSVSVVKNKEGKNVSVVNGGISNIGKFVLDIQRNNGSFEVKTQDACLLSFSKGSLPKKNQSAYYKSPSSNNYNYLKSVLDNAFEKSDLYVNTEIGTLSGKWDKKSNYYYEQSDSYDLVHKAQIWACTSANGIDTSLCHVVSATTPVPSGNFSLGSLNSAISLKDCYSLYRYDNNTLFMIKLTGAKLKAWMQRTARTYKIKDENLTGAGYGTDQFYGVNYKINMSNKSSSRVTDITWPNGKPVLDSDELYLCLSSYRLSASSASDSYGWFKATGVTLDSPEVVWDASLSEEFASAGGSVPLILASYVQNQTLCGKALTPGSETHWSIVR